MTAPTIYDKSHLEGSGARLMYAVDADGVLRPVICDTSGQLILGAQISVSDIQIGAVELKDATAANRAAISAAGALSVETVTRGYSSAASFTPAAASHTNGDVVGGAQEFATIGPSGGNIIIRSATLLIAGGTIETTAWKLHLFNVTPPSALADDAAFALPSGDRASYLGFIDLAQVVDYGDTLYIEANSINKQVKLASTSLFAYLVNGTTLTPQAVAHTVTLFAEAI